MDWHGLLLYPLCYRDRDTFQPLPASALDPVSTIFQNPHPEAQTQAAVAYAAATVAAAAQRGAVQPGKRSEVSSKSIATGNI
jgi:hypothetical protein